MDLYDETDYKAALRRRLRERAGEGRKLTLKRVAQKVGIQYTYLSRALNQETSHLGEDHLYAICRLLELFPEEIDFLFLLRQLAIAGSEERRTYLLDKVNRLKRARKLNASVREVDSRQIRQEMGYLFDPLCQIVLISLTIPEYLEAPRRLCSPLGISPPRLSEILRKLADLGFIELGSGNESVAKVLRTHFHYGTDHPLMRVHQMLLRNLSGTRLAQAPEADKHQFMATFSADDETLRAIREDFQVFLKGVEKRVMKTSPRHTCQLGFELFKWL